MEWGTQNYITRKSKPLQSSLLVKLRFVFVFILVSISIFLFLLSYKLSFVLWLLSRKCSFVSGLCTVEQAKVVIPSSVNRNETKQYIQSNVINTKNLNDLKQPFYLSRGSWQPSGLGHPTALPWPGSESRQRKIKLINFSQFNWISNEWR